MESHSVGMQLWQRKGWWACSTHTIVWSQGKHWFNNNGF